MDQTGYQSQSARRWFTVALLFVLSGCHSDHNQSMLHPASSASAHIAWLWWFLFAVCTAVFVVVMALTWVAIRKPREAESRPGWKNGFIVVGGAIIPAIILVIILFASLGVQKALRLPETNLTIEVIGHKWWWEVVYPDERIITANEIYIPVGEPVRLELSSADVIHSLWIPNLQGKTDMLPDKVNVTWIEADRAGTFRGQCAEYCGVQHALMRLVVVALPREEFDAWVQARQQPVVAPTEAVLQRGREVFFAADCNNCHTIADVQATTKRGPDLTHIGTRRTLAAGVLPNNRGNLTGWISNPQAIKPGNLMPRTHLESEDLHALVEYLESLE